MKKKLIVLFIFFINYKSIAQYNKIHFYYIEFISRYTSEYTKNGYLSGQYLISPNDSIITYLENPELLEKSDKVLRLLNFASRDLQQIEYPDSALRKKDYKEVDWNRKVSLYRGNDFEPYKLIKYKGNNEYAFYIKDVVVSGNMVKNNIVLASHPIQIPFEKDSLFLLNYIHSQKDLEFYLFTKFNDKIEYHLFKDSFYKFHPSAKKVWFSNKEFTPTFLYPNNW